MKAHETAVLLVESALRAGDVQLHHLSAGVALPSVGDPHLHADLRLLRSQVEMFDPQCLDRKIRVGQTIAKAVPHRDRKGVKIAVSHIDPLHIRLLLDVPVVVREHGRVRVIRISARPAVCQFAAGDHIAAEQIRERIAGLHPRLVHVQDRLNVRIAVREGQIDDAPRVEHEYHMRIQRAHSLYDLRFLLGEHKVPAAVDPVFSLTGLSAPRRTTARAPLRTPRHTHPATAS